MTPDERFDAAMAGAMKTNLFGGGKTRARVRRVAERSGQPEELVEDVLALEILLTDEERERARVGEDEYDPERFLAMMMELTAEEIMRRSQANFEECRPRLLARLRDSYLTPEEISAFLHGAAEQFGERAIRAWLYALEGGV